MKREIQLLLANNMYTEVTDHYKLSSLFECGDITLENY